MKKILIENIVKNTVILILLLVFYQPLLNLFKSINSEHYGSLLITASLLIMAVLFADYAFTYEHTKMKSFFNRFISYGTTFLTILCTGLMLESVVILVNLETGLNVWVITFVAVAFYISLVMYDFWDLLRSRLE